MVTEINITDMVAELIGPCLTEFVVLFNPTVKEINAIARLRPGMFIYSFITKGNVENPPDYRRLIKSNYVLQPFWLVDIDKKDWNKIIRHLIEPVLKGYD